MMNRLFIGLIIHIIFYFLSISSLAAQQFPINIKNARFEDLVKIVEQFSSYKFYFENSDVDTLKINFEGNISVQELLSRVLESNNINFVIDDRKNIYITGARVIQTKLPVGALPNYHVESTDVGDFDPTVFHEKVIKQSDADKPLPIGTKSSDLKGNASITGVIRLANTGEFLPGVALLIPELAIGVSSDALGQYKVTIPKGRRLVTFQSIGFKPVTRNIFLFGDGKMDIEMTEEVTALKDVVISSDKEYSISGVQMGKSKIDIRTMRQMPLALGETDALKIVLMLPGVQSVGEGANGLNVRGGASNQNLILFNGATIFNPNHLFGFFSTFNPDILKGIEIYKSGFEANQGGRLSSVLEVTGRDGNFKRFTVTGGVSPITGRLTLEIPLIKDKTSLLIAGRSTYSDWILKRLEEGQFNKSSASFYDLNFHFTHNINERNQFSVSAYKSNDQFRLNSDTLYKYQDQNLTMKWSHRINQKMFTDLTFTASEYNFWITSRRNPLTAFTLESTVQQSNLKYDIKYILNGSNTVHFGMGSILYKVLPGNYLPGGSESLVSPNRLMAERGLESTLYIGNLTELTPKFSLYLGLRYSLFSSIGQRSLHVYAPDSPIEISSLIDTLQIAGISKTYHGPEPRLNIRYLLNSRNSLKLSYSRTRQYIQMLSNNTSVAPTDIWKLSDHFIRPQIADQFSIGWFTNSSRGLFEFSTEAYYKHISQVTDFQNGATLIQNSHIETDILNARGKAYGFEFMTKKTIGRLNGWISYTWSRTFMKTNSKFPIEQVNDGRYYPSNFDKPHALNLVGNYKISRRLNISFNATYSTGRPITLPLVKYQLDGSSRLDYSARNAFRIPDYIRSDVSINLEGNHRVKKIAHYSWTFAIYNLTGRRNAYSVFFKNQNGIIKGYKLSVFGQAIPTLTYNFKL